MSVGWPVNLEIVPSFTGPSVRIILSKADFAFSHGWKTCCVLYNHDMSDQPPVDVDVNIVGNPSLSIEKAIVTLTAECFTSAYQLQNDVEALCSGQPHRIYWRVTELDYLPISGYIGLKAALNVMNKPRLYVIMDEPSFIFIEFSDENFERGESKNAGLMVNKGNEDSDDEARDDEYDVCSLLRDSNKGSSNCTILTDLEILRCATGCQVNDKGLPYDCLMTRSREIFTRENNDINRQLAVLMKGFPEAKAARPVEISFAETKKISSAGTSSRGGARKKSNEFKTGNNVKEISGGEPIRSEGRLDEITNTWRDVKRALSLLCVKTFSSSAAMLEAPPGSREDLVEAARTPCTPTDLDTMLYGYTNSIYVLDHTPESLPDMDMLQLFASPAGRALVTGDNRPSTRGGSTSTSLSRESSTGAKSRRRASSTVNIPTPPPRQRKSSAELYKEAVEILGLTCSLTDSCRCLDCQSNYFDCDDDCGDARSELAAGTPILLDHALSHPLTCSIQ